MSTLPASFPVAPKPAPAVKPLDLAIVGMGCLFPKADTLGGYWANIKHAIDGITDVPGSHWNPDDYFDANPKAPDMTYARRGGFLSPIDFNALEFGINPRDLEATDTTQLLGLYAAKQALTDAGVDFTPGRPKSVERGKVSVLIGVTGTLELVIPLGARLGHPKWRKAMRDAGIPEDQVADAVTRIADSYVPWQENSFPGLLGNVVAGRIANRLDLHGTNCVVDAACASSLSAMHLAAMELTTGKADVVVTGGTDTFNDIFMYMCFSKTPALSPSGNSRPFDADGDGTILGEGLGLVVLKRLDDAVAAGDTVYAVIKSIGTSSDGKGNAIYAPSADGQKRCLKDAYARAGFSPDTVELVEAHGTGTKVGDGVEAAALADVFGGVETSRSRPWCAVGSVKSQVGHTKAAAGAAGLIKAAMALHFKVLPPTMKVTKPVEPLLRENTPFYVNAQMRPWLPRAEHPRRAGLSAFGFGGSNFHAVLEEFGPTKVAPDWDGHVEMLTLSGTAQAVAGELAKLADGITWKAFARAAEASRATFQVDAPARLILVAHRDANLAKLLSGAKAKLAADGTKAWSTTDGAHFGVGAPAGQLGVLFPGQGSQYVGMLRESACLFPEMLDALTAVDADADAGGKRVADVVYPVTSFAPDAKASQDAALRSTDVAQPAIGAVSFGAWLTLSHRFGVSASAFGGHSYGELTALAAAGRLSVADFVTLSRLRGRLMAEQGDRKSGDPGTMLAVSAHFERIEAVVAAENLDVVAANFNSPTQTVLSGSTPEIDRAARAFIAAGLRATKLPVAAAFHSPFVAEAAKPFRAALDAVALSAGTKPVYANTTAAPYPAEADAAKDILGHQLAKPVAFVEQVRAMAQAGVTTFLEVGPGSVLTRLTEATLAELKLPGEAFALDSSGGKRPGTLDLAQTLARLAARGYAVAVAAWEEGSRCRPGVDPKPGHTVPVGGANSVLPRPARPATPPKVSPSVPVPSAVAERRSPSTPPGKVMSDRPSEPAPLNTGQGAALTQALALSQQTLAALAHLQEQSARLHKQFLDNQSQAHATLFQIVAQQNAMIFGADAPALPAPRAAAPNMPVPTMPAPARPAVVPTPVAAPPVARVEAPRPVLTAPVAAKPVPVAAARNAISDVLLEVVAEKTGYPTDMLSLGMTLDSDLGVDSIKRVEILSALQERLPHAPVVKPEHLGTLHTLQDIADFLGGADPARQTVAVEPDALGLMSQSALAASTAGAAKAKVAAGDPTDALFGLLANSPQQVSDVLLEVVAEKTGYPTDMLSLGMTLDSDLGVDSIKRVEILSALQERLPHAPVVKPEHLGTLHTLQDIADFLGGSSHTAKIEVQALRHAPKSDDGSVPSSAADRPAADRAISPLDRKSSAGPDGHATDGGIATVPLSAIRQELLSESIRPSARRRTTGGLGDTSTLSEVANALEALRNPIVTGAIENIDRSILQLVNIDLASGRPNLAIADGAEFWLVAQPDDAFATEIFAQLTAQHYTVKQFPWLEPGAVKPAGTPAALVLLPPVHCQGLPFNRLAFQWVQACGPKLRQVARQGAATLIASVARLDGEFGLGEITPGTDPTAGGLAGLIKTARHEWPELGYKALDVAAAYAHQSPAAAAAALLDELCLAGPIEVGIGARHRCTLELARTARRPVTGSPVLGPKDVVLVTGGARGVTAEVAVALAEAFQCTLVLTGRTPVAAGPEPEFLRGLTDESAIKRAILENLGAAATPKSVGESYAKTLAQREVARTVARIQAVGAKAAYYSVNVSNGRQLADLIHQVKVKYGAVTGLVHGAGVLADKRIDDLTPESFDLVYNTKVEGLRNLLDILANQDLKAMILFSSTTARYGRTGQVAYAVANEVLNKTAQVEARKRPTTRVVSLNWGPWEGGMVTPGLRKLFESEGIGLIPMGEGAMFAVQELSAAGRSVEVIALGKAVRSGKSAAMTSTGSGTAPALTTPQPLGNGSGSLPTPATLPPNPDLAFVFERTVEIATHPILRSHVLDHHAVLPMAVHIEWIAHAALHNNPGLVFHGLNALRVTRGVKTDEGVPTVLKAYSSKAVRDGDLFQVVVELRGLPRNGREVPYSRAEVVLTAKLPAAPVAEPDPSVVPYPHTMEEVYRHFLFHGPDLQAIESVVGLTDLAVVATAYPAASPNEWFTNPLRSSWVAEPMVLDAAFQLMILWSLAQHGSASLPCFMGRYRQYRRSFPAAPVKVVIRVTRDNGTFARADMDFLDAAGAVVAQLQDFECMIDANLAQSFRRNTLAPRS